MDGHSNSILSHHHMMDYGTGTSRAKEQTSPADDESESSNTTCTTYTVPPSQVVELATLTVPDNNDDYSDKCNNMQTVILHTSKETAYALEAADVDVEANTNACIQAVVDMEKLSQLAHATDDEFVGGLLIYCIIL